MQHNELMSRSFFCEQNTAIPTDLIYDEVYKNESSKNKYSHNPKYVYYNALLSMKQKLSEHQTPVYNSLFNPQKPRHLTPTPPPEATHKVLMPVYHVQKINKMKFKVYKQNGPTQFVERLPVTDLSFQIKIRGDPKEQTRNNFKPRLEEILNQYRKMNLNTRNSKSRGGDIRRSSLGHGSDMNMKMMRHTMTKIGRSATTHRK